MSQLRIVFFYFRVKIVSKEVGLCFSLFQLFSLPGSFDSTVSEITFFHIRFFFKSNRYIAYILIG